MDLVPEIAGEVSQRGVSALEWLSLRLGLGEALPAAVMLSAMAAVIVIIVVPMLWIMVRYPVTIVHEMGHVIMARLCGRSVTGIRVHTDTSGLAVTRGAPHGLGMALTAIAGYLAPGALGLACVWAATSSRAGFALFAIFGLLIAALLLVRNLWGVAVVFACLIGVWTAMASVDGQLVSAIVLICGLVLALGSVRAVVDLMRLHRRGQADDSDAVGATAAVKNLVSPAVWLIFFAAGTGACAVMSLWLVITAVVS